MVPRQTKPSDERLAHLQAQVSAVPTGCGVYRWLDSDGEILYIGKAKNLRSRLRSYLKDDVSQGPWKRALFRHLAGVEVTVTSNELEALILETNLIKEIRPKYNVMMKDDKNYVYVRISVYDPFPSVTVVRRMESDGAKYFGPFLQAYMVKRTLDALHTVFPFRASKQTLQTLNKRARDGEPVDEPIYRVAPLMIQIGRECPLGTGEYTQEQYRAAIDQVIRFFQGDHKPVLQALKEQMQRAATDKKFERAAELRDTYAFVQSLAERQEVSGTSGANLDAIGVAIQGTHAHVVVLRERGGKLVGERHFSLAGQAEGQAAVLAQFVPQYYGVREDIPAEVLLACVLEEAEVLEQWLSERRGKSVRIHLPQRGHKAKLLEMAEENARGKLQQHLASWEAAEQNAQSALEALQERLDLPEVPKRIEGYDISHLGGTETVGSMVVLRDGKTANDHYRSFTIRSLKETEIDDYQALREVLSRRLRHVAGSLREEEERWKSRGITVGKARKAELEFILDTLERQSGQRPEDLEAKEFLVARDEGGVIGFVRFLAHSKTQQEVRSFWVAEDHRGEKLGQFLLRKLLHTLKDGKAYIVCYADLEQYYASIGFRYVRTSPKPITKRLAEKAKQQPECSFVGMVYEAQQNKPDPSLSAKPDLLVIDGGKGQLSTVVEVLKVMQMDIPVIGLAKREEEVFIPGQRVAVDFPKDSPAKLLLMRLRNEAHRFANRHRERRGKRSATQSALDAVPGVGPATQRKLLKTFGSVTGIRQASDADLSVMLTPEQLRAIRERL